MSNNKEFLEVVKYLEDFDFSGKTLLPSQGNNDVYIVMIFASWCGFCVKAFPEYYEFAKRVATEGNSNIQVCCIQADGDRESEQLLGKKLKDTIDGFRGFPHFCIYKNGKKIADYNGERKAQNFYDFCKSQ